MESAENLHSRMYIDGYHVTQYTDHVYVYSNNHSTVSSLIYDPGFYSLYYLYTYSYSACGDGMVPTISATMDNLSNAYFVDASHTGMIMSASNISVSIIKLLFKRGGESL